MDLCLTHAHGAQRLNLGFIDPAVARHTVGEALYGLNAARVFFEHARNSVFDTEIDVAARDFLYRLLIVFWQIMLAPFYFPSPYLP